MKMQKICYVYAEKFESKHFKDKNYCKVRDHCHGNIELLRISCVI